MSEENKSGDKKKSPFGKMPKPPGKGFNFSWIYAIVFLLIFVIWVLGLGDKPKLTNMNEFEKTMLATHDVEKIEIVNRERVEITIKKDKLNQEKYKAVSHKPFGNGYNPGPHYYMPIGDVGNFESKLEAIQKDFPENERIQPEYNNNDRSILEVLFWNLLPFIIIAVIWIFIMRRMGGGGAGSQIFNIGKSKAQLFDKDLNVKVTFNDVAGLEEAKVEVMEIVDFLKNPKKYTQLGGKIPRGALLVGPPGTGKTLLAKAVAGEAQVPFFSLSGSDFVEMFVGVGASRVRDLFRQAKEKAPDRKSVV